MTNITTQTHIDTGISAGAVSPTTTDYDFSQVPEADRAIIKKIIASFEGWHDASRVLDPEVTSTREALGQLWPCPGKGMLYFNLTDISTFHKYAGGPGVIAPDGTVRGTINGIGPGAEGTDVRFNLLTDPIVIDRDVPETQDPPSTETIEGIQALAASNPELAAMLKSPESIYDAIKTAVSTKDAASFALVFVPGSLAKIADLPEGTSNFVVATLVIGSLPSPPALGEMLWERQEQEVIRRSYSTDDASQSQEFQRHGEIWLAEP